MGLIGDSSLILKETVVLPMLSEFGDSVSFKWFGFTCMAVSAKESSRVLNQQISLEAFEQDL